MGPGDACEYASLTDESAGKSQRYEDRIAVTRQQAPFAVAAGLGMVVFGLTLARRRQGRSDIGPKMSRSSS